MIVLEEESTVKARATRGNWCRSDLPGHSRVNFQKNVVVLFLIAKFWIPVFKIRKICGFLFPRPLITLASTREWGPRGSVFRYLNTAASLNVLLMC